MSSSADPLLGRTAICLRNYSASIGHFTEVKVFLLKNSGRCALDTPNGQSEFIDFTENVLSPEGLISSNARAHLDAFKNANACLDYYN